MKLAYRDDIARLIKAAPFEIDTGTQVPSRRPTMANSMFLTNKAQGDWAEEIVFRAINERMEGFRAIRYGRSDSLAAGDRGFADFYAAYVDELNYIGKKPDILVYRTEDVAAGVDLEDGAFICKALAAIEVRSSSFLSDRYSSFTAERTHQAELVCQEIRDELLREPKSTALLEKSPALHEMIRTATAATFRELDFRARSWASSPVLREVSDLLAALKEQIRVLHKRDYLSITPKLEDLALVNRWIQRFNVRHFYLQVFFDKAYIIPFRRTLEIASDPSNEGEVFSVERDVKNQGKTTIKMNVQAGKEIIRRIDMPAHRSVRKELERGRLLFYVSFNGGRGYLDPAVFQTEIVDDG